MNKVRVEWKAFHQACFHTSRRILENHSHIDTIVALARGGLVPARIMAEYIKPDNFYIMGLSLYNGHERREAIRIYQDVPSHMFLNRPSNILVVDDNRFKKSAPKAEIITATPYIKTGTTFTPDYYVTEFAKDEWIVFPFEEE